MTPSPNQEALDKRRQQHREAQFAMRLSLLVGVLMLTGKMTAYLLTDSSAVFSDAAESVVHVVAVIFAVFSLWLSSRPAVPGNDDFAFFPLFDGLHQPG